MMFGCFILPMISSSGWKTVTGTVARDSSVCCRSTIFTASLYGCFRCTAARTSVKVPSPSFCPMEYPSPSSTAFTSIPPFFRDWRLVELSESGDRPQQKASRAIPETFRHAVGSRGRRPGKRCNAPEGGCRTATAEHNPVCARVRRRRCAVVLRRHFRSRGWPALRPAPLDGFGRLRQEECTPRSRSLLGKRIVVRKARTVVFSLCELSVEIRNQDCCCALKR